MVTSRRRPAETFADQALALAHGAWVELGVSGWTSTHSAWGVDPEPLILFTAWLGDADPRLRDEATDWCIRNWRHVNKVRLRNLLADQPDDVRDLFGEFAATVGVHAGITWPGATDDRAFTVTGRSTLAPLDGPSAAWLRLRAMFGMTVRSEILRCFLSRGERSMTVARLAELTAYTKRNVADECDTLHLAGVLALRTRGGRFFYSLARRASLEAFVGDLPHVRPHWPALLNVARELVDLEQRVDEATVRTLPVHVRRALRRMHGDLDEVDVEPLPESLVGDELWPAVRRLGRRHLGAWSIGRWPAELEVGR